MIADRVWGRVARLSLPFGQKVLRTALSPGAFQGRPAPTPRYRHERPHRLSRPAKTRSALQAHAAVSARQGRDALQEGDERRRAGREGARPRYGGGVARGAAVTFGGRLWRHQPLSAPGASEAAAR